MACRANDADLVKLLLEHGANPNRIGRRFKAEGQRPADLTEEKKIVELLRTYAK